MRTILWNHCSRYASRTRTRTSNSNSNSFHQLFHSTTRTTMGVTKEILQAGNGSKPTAGQEVTVHCTGYGKNNDLSQKFWSTKDPGQKTFSFTIAISPWFMVMTPSSQPLMTCPLPMVKLKVFCPGSFVDQNFWDKSLFLPYPVQWTVTSCPAVGLDPFPAWRISFVTPMVVRVVEWKSRWKLLLLLLLVLVLVLDAYREQ